MGTDDKPKQFILYKDVAGEWRWHLRAQGNSKIIASSAEGYHNRADAIHGARLVAQVSPGAPIWDTSSSEWV